MRASWRARSPVNGGPPPCAVLVDFVAPEGYVEESLATYPFRLDRVCQPPKEEGQVGPGWPFRVAQAEVPARVLIDHAVSLAARALHWRKY